MNTTAIEYLESQGFAGDYDLASVITSFFNFLISRDDEEKDDSLREVNFHLNRVVDRQREARDLEYIVKMNAKMKSDVTRLPIGLQWFTFKSQEDIPIERVVKDYSLSHRETEFLLAIHYKNLRIGVALALIDELISDVNYNPDNLL